MQKNIFFLSYQTIIEEKAIVVYCRLSYATIGIVCVLQSRPSIPRFRIWLESKASLWVHWSSNEAFTSCLGSRTLRSIFHFIIELEINFKCQLIMNNDWTNRNQLSLIQLNPFLHFCQQFHSSFYCLPNYLLNEQNMPNMLYKYCSITLIIQSKR